MSRPIAAARSHRPARRWPSPPPVSPSHQHLEPTTASRVLPATHPGEGASPARHRGGYYHPCGRCLMGRHAQGMHIHGLGLHRRPLVSGGFLQARSQAGRRQSPPRGCLALLARSSPPAPRCRASAVGRRPRAGQVGRDQR